MKFEALIENLIKSPFRGTLSNPIDKKSDIKKISLRSLLIKNKPCFQAALHYRNKDVHENHPVEYLKEYLEKLFMNYKQGNFSAENGEYHVLVSSSGKMTILVKKTQKKIDVISHNRVKNTILKEGVPIPFLVELGVMSKEGKIVAAKSHKFRQVNRFLEIIQDVIESLGPKKKIHIVDFGCGKSYLTFALYHYLVNVLKISAVITGLDLKEDVITECNQLAKNLGYAGLQFEVGKIEGYAPKHPIDMVIALHACDTATDAAIAQALKWGAEAILAVPCCQHELYGQIKNKEMSSLLKHGILKERFAALVTDAVRANLLEMEGYRTQVMEFIDLEHTPKNLLIKAIKTDRIPPRAKEEYKSLKNLLSFDHALERLLSP